MSISACGGSDSGGTSAPGTTTTISGSVFAAPVSGASVVIKSAGGTTVAGPVTTAHDGTYSIDIPTGDLNSDLRIESAGGTYTDEATQTTTSAGTFAAYVSAGTLTTGSVHIDPFTTILHELVAKHSMTFLQARTALSNALGFVPDCSVASSNVPSNSSNTAQRLRAFRAGVLSELVKELGLTPDKQAELIAAIVLDLADDGLLNGSAGSVNGSSLPEDLQSLYDAALVSYLSNTTANLTGVTSGDIGDLVFAKVALTPTYRVEYVPGMMAPIAGKTQFKLKVTYRMTHAAASGLTLSLMPLMHMPGMSHTAPVDAVVEDGANPGTYNCTVYYLMTSGPMMGFWDLKVAIGSGMSGESATFHPPVGMGMGDTKKFNLKGGANDYISSGMSGTSTRTYMLFNDGLVSGMTSTFNLFIATMESMMNMPPVSIGTVLSSPVGTVQAGTTSLQASLDTSFSSVVTGSDLGSGHWTIPGISSLVTGTQNSVYIKWTVNGEVKTSGSGTATVDYATFSVTPGM
ncbi:MAG TPA: hypothetical protein VK445_03185 [Dissulfurispiraceae bacterium]|nr:hypothetical protein [Dissulfurispiraceae bacterium]